MKYIKKQKREPKNLRDWVSENKNSNCDYENSLPTAIKHSLYELMLNEQGHICCYTGKRISKTNSHIEHVFPQSKCKQCRKLRKGKIKVCRPCDNKDVLYHNMIVSIGTYKKELQYGGTKRKEWYDPQNFIHPLLKSCGNLYSFSSNGEISGKTKAAKSTIKALGLDDTSLTEDRNNKVYELFISSPLSVSEIKRIISNIYNKNSSGEFTEYCFVLKSAGEEILKKAEKEAKKKKYIVRRKTK